MQIVGYETAAGAERDQPALLVAGDGAIERESLAPGRQLGYSLGRRHCAGTIDDTGHTSCEADGAPYCPTHTKRWACARCRGDCDRPLPSCHEEHAVYLAAFAPATFKVGVTRSWRLETRLREQGADRAAHLRTVADGKIARQIEAEIAADVGDQVRVPTKIRGLHQGVSTEAWETLLSEYDLLSTYSFDYGLSLQERPVAETMLTGTVRGAQGRVLVLERNGTVYAVDLRDLVGHELTDGSTDRALQSSLASFE
ncbi:DUF2797 domain-containing protein [Halobacteriaceae archaeon SHR40]|uniref:DUF2797 domain-containing protein n=1 Tax=Halovenus amylolytica TaxID=2500550 RepID=UPI000FE2A917